MLSLVAAMLLAPLGGAPEPLVVLATHDTANAFERRVVERPIIQWQEEAAERGYVVEHQDEQGIVFVRHRDLFNLDAMTKQIEAVGVAEALIKAGKTSPRMGDLPEKDRASLQGLLANSAVGRELGPLIMQDKTQVSIEAMVKVSLTNGGQSMEFSMPQPVSKLGDGFFNRPPTADAIEKFNKDALPGLAMKGYPDSLKFTFGKSSLASAAKVAASEAFSKRIFELLEAQRLQFVSTQQSLRAALMAAGGLPKDAEEVNLLSDSMQRFLNGAVIDNPTSFGFQDQGEAMKFVAGARVNGYRVLGLVGVGVVRPNGQKEIVYANLSFSRNPGN